MSPSLLRVAGHFAERHFAERHFAERHFAERTFCRTDILPNRHFAEWTFYRTDSLTNGLFAAQKLSISAQFVNRLSFDFSIVDLRSNLKTQ